MWLKRVVMAAAIAGTAAAAAPVVPGAAESCWIEYSAGDAPGAMSAAGAKAPVWHNTASGILVRHRSGDVLIDAGWSRNAAAQMSELSPAKRPVAERILAALAWRRTAPEALAAASEVPSRLGYILPTHAHYDHLAGAEDLPGVPILLAREEIDFLDRELSIPDIVAGTSIRAVRDRLRPITFRARPYLGFARSFDVFSDGSIVVVPLPGHTPGSVGVFLTVHGRRVFHIGDAAFVSEAVASGLPKIGPLRSVVDDNGPAADRQVLRLQKFHAQHPDVLILPAHDRTAWQEVFGPTPTCVAM